MNSPPFAIGIAGGTGAGKTTVARRLAANVDAEVTLVPLDNYYADFSELPFDERREINYDHPSAFDWELLRTHLDALRRGDSIAMPEYDFTEHKRMDARTRVDPTDVVIIEGILSLYDRALTEDFDLRVYVETDPDVRILRRIRRDVIERDRDLEGVIEQYLGTVKPMHEQFVEPTKKRADVIIPDGANSAAVGLLSEKIHVETGSR